MFNFLFDWVLCGRSICCAACGRLTNSFQDEEADLWRDLTFQNTGPEPKAPPVPSIVEFRSDSDEYDDDDGSFLFDPYGHYQLGRGPHELELRVETVARVGVTVNENSDNARLVCRPLHRNTDLDEECDGSSYSSFKRLDGKSELRLQTLPWQSDSSESTIQTQNHSIRSLTVTD